MTKTPQIHLQDVLANLGPCRSSQVVTEMTSLGIAASTARKRLSRAKPPIHRLERVRFSHNETFVYLNNQYNNVKFWRRLLRAFQDTHSRYDFCVQALRSRGGIVPYDQFMSLTGHPNTETHRFDSRRIRDDLMAIKLLEGVDIPPLGPCLRLNPRAFRPVSEAEFRSRMLAEKVMLDALRDWSRKIGLVSYGKVRLRDPTSIPEMGSFHWDMTAPAYCHPFVQKPAPRQEPKPGFFVADVVLRKRLSPEHAGYFFKKCETYMYFKNARPLMAMLLSDGFTNDALKRGKSRGLLMATPDAMFGRGTSRSLGELIHELTEAAKGVESNPDKIYTLFDRLSRIEGASLNLRGPLFEFIVYYCVSKLEAGEKELGRIATSPKNGQRADIDVFRRSPQETCAYECKGKSAATSVGRTEIEDWLSRQVPRIREWMLDKNSDAPQRFEYWTTGSFSPDAIDLLIDMSEKTKKYTIGWKDGRQVRNYAMKTGNRRIVQILDEQYFKNPATSSTR